MELLVLQTKYGIVKNICLLAQYLNYLHAQTLKLVF